MTPLEFELQIRKIEAATKGDDEAYHNETEKLMCTLLASLGYYRGANRIRHDATVGVKVDNRMLRILAASIQMHAQLKAIADFARNGGPDPGDFSSTMYTLDYIENGSAPCGSQKWKRAGGDCECAYCGKLYRQHPQESGPGYGSCSDDILYLHRLCDGSLVHL